MCLGSPPWGGVSRTGATAGVHRGGLLWAKKQKGTRAVFVLAPPPGLLRTEYGVHTSLSCSLRGRGVRVMGDWLHGSLG